MTMLAQEAKHLLRPPLEQRLLTPIQFLRGIPAWNSHRLLVAFCVYGGADHTLGIEVDPEVVTDRNDLVFEPIGALGTRNVRVADQSKGGDDMAQLIRSSCALLKASHALMIGLCLASLQAKASVTRLVINRIESPTLGGTTFGEGVPYEKLLGVVYLDV